MTKLWDILLSYCKYYNSQIYNNPKVIKATDKCQAKE